MNTATQTSPDRFPDNLPKVWREKLAGEAEKPYFKKLSQFLVSEYQSKKNIFPERPNILRALQAIDLPDVRVVILGQDPYHGKGQALGLCFGVPNSLRVKPPSLVNIFKEISDNFKKPVDKTKSELTSWVNEGVLLLNAVLTVREGLPLSHRDKGWEIFTDEIIRVLNEREEPLIFLLWGASAQKKAEIISTKKHFILKTVHPSPLSAHRGFLGSKHFLKANQILVDKLHREPIDWTKTE